jgi:predicted ArsR family transcriptional regulator
MVRVHTCTKSTKDDDYADHDEENLLRSNPMDADPPPTALGSPPRDLDDRLERLSALQEPLRRALYLFIASQGREVGREEAAEEMGIRRSLAAFHLDKLAEAGLLEVSYRRLTGRSGPGAGRPAKLYRRSPETHQVSVPPRDYELAAHLMAMAMEQAGRRSASRELERVARDFGASLGQEQREQLGPRPGRRRQTSAIEDVLSRYGFAPYREGHDVRLGNCPFHSLAREHTGLACGMNLALIDGLLAGMQLSGTTARLDPRPEQCCVVLGPTVPARTDERQGPSIEHSS